MWGVDQDSSYFVIWFFFLYWILPSNPFFYWIRRRRSRDGMVVGFTTTYAISTYHHYRCEIESRSATTLCDKVCQWLAAGQLFSPGSPVSYTSKTDLQDITEIVLKVALNTMNQTWIIYCIKNITVGLNFEMMYFPTPTSASFIVPQTQFFCPYVTHTTCTCIIAILCIYDIEAG
jgi:hypothetical protein